MRCDAVIGTSPVPPISWNRPRMVLCVVLTASRSYIMSGVDRRVRVVLEDGGSHAIIMDRGEPEPKVGNRYRN